MQYQALKDLMDRLTNWRIPGNAAIAYRGDQEVFSYASGFADVDTKNQLALFYAHHMLNQQERYYQPRVRNAFFSCSEV